MAGRRQTAPLPLLKPSPERNLRAVLLRAGAAATAFVAVFVLDSACNAAYGSPPPFVAVPTCCTEKTYLEVTSWPCLDHPETLCANQTVYYLCEEGQYSGCACVRPGNGWTYAGSCGSSGCGGPDDAALPSVDDCGSTESTDATRDGS
jgi:hypothetical protein